MTLEEAIDNFEREIVEFEGFKKIHAVTHEEYAKIERTRQLAEWMKELQTYRNRECETCKYSEDGKCAGTEKCHECMWQNQYEQELCDEDAHNKWIPVTEKRPELGVKVLIQRAKFGEFDIGFYDDYHERICWQNGTKHTEMVPHWWYFGGRLSDEDPIAWMPLPEPYDTWIIKRDADALEKSLKDYIKENYIPKKDMWSMKEVTDALEKHGLIGK